MRFAAGVMVVFFLLMYFVANLLGLTVTGGGDRIDLTTFWFTTDKTVTVAWSPDAVATSYEVELYSVERKVSIPRGQTTLSDFALTMPWAGHFVVRVRSLHPDHPPSTWASSDDPTYAVVVTDGVAAPKGWTIYGYLAPPGPIQ